ncbi:MAG: hypothetical protein JWR83_3471 [Aeromicrobium sp.]|nr:hypothetical protein [Aeromicrobium sp.]
MLDREIYAYSDVDRIIGLHHGTARRWLEGYTRRGNTYEPVLRESPTHQDIVTWGEMVEARHLAEFRDQHVPVQNMRPAIVRLREEFGRYPLASARALLDTAGRELVMQIQSEVAMPDQLRFVVVMDGQYVLSEAATSFRNSVRFQDGEAEVISPVDRTPAVLLDPTRAFGQPSIRGVRTGAIAEAYRAGSTREELSDLFALTADQVDQAIRYELITGLNASA